LFFVKNRYRGEIHASNKPGVFKMNRFFNEITGGILLLVLFIASISAASVNRIIQGVDGREFLANEVILKIKENAQADSKAQSTATQIESILKRSGVQERPYSLHPVFKVRRPALAKNTVNMGVPRQLNRIYRLKFSSKSDIQKIIGKLNSNTDVVYAEPNYIARICTQPNDSLFVRQWDLNNTGQYFLEDADIDAPEAWDMETGDTTVVLGVLDTGVDYLHPDLAQNMLNDGYDFVNDDSDPMDDNGHGTHVAGIIAAVGNNGIGIAGVAWHAKILPVKVMNYKGMGLYSEIADGVLYAVNHGAQIINLSLGSYAQSSLLKDALETAAGQALIIAAAGNDGVEYDDFGHSFYPASYDFVLGVGASDVGKNSGGTFHEVRAAFSNFGVNADVYAPGVNILSTFPKFHPLRHTYEELSGTSMAAPVVSGMAVLLRAYYPDWSNELIKGQIINTAEPFSGGKWVNAYRALANSIAPMLDFYSATVVDTLPGDDADGNADAGETIQLIMEIENTLAPASNVWATIRPHSSEDTAFVAIEDSTAQLGSLSAYAHADNQTNPFVIRIKSKTPNNQVVYFDYHLAADGGYEFSGIFHLKVQKGIDVGGVLSGETVWSKDYLYMVKSNILIPEGSRLIIEPGTTIRFASNCYLRVDGELAAVGTEKEPIVFTSNSSAPQAGDYQGVKFTDSAVDAEYDVDGNYLSGSTIQYAEIKFAGKTELGGDGGGIFVQDASPYLAHNYVHDNLTGGIVCINSDALVEYNTIQNDFGSGGLRLHHFFGTARYNLIKDNMSDYAGGVYLDYSQGTVEYNIIYGNSSSNVDGGGAMLLSGSSAKVRYNVIAGNRNDSQLGSIWFANEDSTRFEYNTVIDNAGGLDIDGSTPIIRFNNILHNRPYEMQQHVQFSGLPSYDVLATNNYWGTSNQDSLAKWIWDFYDDFDLGKVNYDSVHSEPIRLAPGFLESISLNPSSPVGSETVTFILTFSKPMDISAKPTVTFGVAAPFTQNKILGDWSDSLHWQGTFKVTVMTGDGINYIKVSEAKDRDGLEIPADQRYSFLINAMEASSMDFSAEAQNGFVSLKWETPELDDLLGYNLYRYVPLTDTTYSDTIQVNQSLIADTCYDDPTVRSGETYFYMYTAVSTDFKESKFSSPVSVTAITGFGHQEELPEKYALEQNYPNPFNPSTVISYSVPRASHVQLEIYDILGRKVAILIDKNQPAGRYKIRWEATKVSSGIYFYRMQAGHFTKMHKMILLH